MLMQCIAVRCFALVICAGLASPVGPDSVAALSRTRDAVDPIAAAPVSQEDGGAAEAWIHHGLEPPEYIRGYRVGSVIEIRADKAKVNPPRIFAMPPEVKVHQEPQKGGVTATGAASIDADSYSRFKAAAVSLSYGSSSGTFVYASSQQEDLRKALNEMGAQGEQIVDESPQPESIAECRQRALNIVKADKTAVYRHIGRQSTFWVVTGIRYVRRLGIRTTYAASTNRIESERYVGAVLTAHHGNASLKAGGSDYATRLKAAAALRSSWDIEMVPQPSNGLPPSLFEAQSKLRTATMDYANLPTSDTLLRIAIIAYSEAETQITYVAREFLEAGIILPSDYPKAVDRTKYKPVAFQIEQINPTAGDPAVSRELAFEVEAVAKSLTAIWYLSHTLTRLDASSALTESSNERIRTLQAKPTSAAIDLLNAYGSYLCQLDPKVRNAEMSKLRQMFLMSADGSALSKRLKDYVASDERNPVPDTLDKLLEALPPSDLVDKAFAWSGISATIDVPNSGLNSRFQDGNDPCGFRMTAYVTGVRPDVVDADFVYFSSDQSSPGLKSFQTTSGFAPKCLPRNDGRLLIMAGRQAVPCNEGVLRNKAEWPQACETFFTKSFVRLTSGGTSIILDLKVGSRGNTGEKTCTPCCDTAL